MPLQATSGAASYDAFGGGVAVVPVYIEQIFQTYLYTGNGSTQTITNGIDLSTKGGLVWTKCRSNAYSNYLIDTVQTKNKILVSNSTAAAITAYDSSYYGLTSFNSDGYSLGPDFTESLNTSGGKTFASWTFRKQPKFFDVVTWSGNGTIGRTISHSLGSEPGCIIVKKTNTTGASDWVVYHRSLGATKAMILNLTDSVYTWNVWNDTAPTSTVFSLNDASEVNGAGNTYVAYLFAHNAGGFGLTGTDNVISCGSFDANNGEVINLGYEPQWLLYKASSDVDNWRIADNMRGLTNLAGTNAQTIKQLRPNSSAVESENSGPVLTSTGFTWNQSGGGVTHIYIAIRRGPMKVPTSGTSVFSPIARTGTGSIATVNVGFAPDFLTTFYRTDAGQDKVVFDRLRGPTQYLNTAATTQEINVSTNGLVSFNNTSFTTNANGYANNSGSAFVNHVFGRAPSFFDEVCYTGTGVAGRTVTHNLTVAPELMIVKGRSNAGQWRVYSSALGATQAARLNSTDSFGSNPYAWNNTAPTASVFTVGDDTGVNENTYTYVAYLFATCAGVSKVGSYTGTGATQTINCGFTGGARFVLIKITNTSGNWFVWDTARGMVVGTDPSLALNDTAAEEPGDSVYTATGGFQLAASPTYPVNSNGYNYIFLAIA